ncbi:NAD(P)-dependent oxidoreductase [Streptomyces sp. NPDC049577]|uniref:NAD(P)-dependent oxidoreductase n=1 Tax=Streptomyces sp. NPDC049577 TaxID=3155153 RepID=UPI00341DBA94
MEEHERTTGHLAVIGLGAMGGGMAHRLLESGFRLTVHNRTPRKAEPLVERGATYACDAAEAVAGHRVVLLSLSDEQAVDEVLFDQVAPALERGGLVIDTSTVSPGYARAAAERLAALGLRRVEACVVGNPLQARKGELRVFTAGPQADAEEVRDVLDALGGESVHFGAPGSATTVKLVLNLLLGAQVASLAEAVEYGARAGIDRDRLLASIAGSGFSSAVMRFRADLMRSAQYEPAYFRASLMEKDLRLAIEAAERSGVELPVLKTVRDRFAAVVAAGDGDKDAAVVVEHTAH